MAQITGVRWRVEELFENCKGYLGMGHYKTRAWTSWHHHMALVAVAHLFLTLTRLRFKKDATLTLPMTFRLLCAILPQPKLTVDDA